MKPTYKEYPRAAFPSARFGNPYSFDSLRSVSTVSKRLGHSLKILFKTRSEIIDCLMIYSRTAFVGLYHTKGAPKVRHGIDLVHQAVPFASFHPVFQGRQHTFRPDARFHPRPAAPDLSGPSSLFRHCRRLCLPFVFPSRIHLPASLGSTPITALHRYYGGSDSCTPLSMRTGLPASRTTFLTIPSPTTWCSPVVALSRYPQLDRSPCCFSAAHRLTSQHGSRLRHSLAGSPESPGRIGFVILRTGRSPPVALHPASRRRSYSRLQAGAYTWRGLAPL